MSIFTAFSRRASLRALFALDDRRLSDMGLTRFDLADARRMASTALLNERRNERAGFWLR